jgi:hypothetical protein
MRGVFNYYHTKRLQLGVAMAYAHGAIYSNTDASALRTAPEAILSYWFTSRIRGLASYAYIHTAPDLGLTTDEHHVAVALLVRLG